MAVDRPDNRTWDQQYAGNAAQPTGDALAGLRELRQLLDDSAPGGTLLMVLGFLDEKLGPKTTIGARARALEATGARERPGAQQWVQKGDDQAGAFREEQRIADILVSIPDPKPLCAKCGCPFEVHDRLAPHYKPKGPRHVGLCCCLHYIEPPQSIPAREPEGSVIICEGELEPGKLYRAVALDPDKTPGDVKLGDIFECCKEDDDRGPPSAGFIDDNQSGRPIRGWYAVPRGGVIGTHVTAVELVDNEAETIADITTDSRRKPGDSAALDEAWLGALKLLRERGADVDKLLADGARNIEHYTDSPHHEFPAEMPADEDEDPSIIHAAEGVVLEPGENAKLRERLEAAERETGEWRVLARTREGVETISNQWRERAEKAEALLLDWEVFGASISGSTNHEGRVALDAAKHELGTHIRVIEAAKEWRYVRRNSDIYALEAAVDALTAEPAESEGA